MLVDGCVESGYDVTEGGARINTTGMVGIASANAGDSLYAIKKAVFEDKRFTLDELARMLNADFEGFELERQHLINKIPKYGNDIDAVDDMVVMVTKRWFDQLDRYENYFGGGVWAALYSVTTQVGTGNLMGALPDGRKAHMPLADGLTPMYGRDISGPTAALKSVSKVDLMRSPNGCIVNQRFSPEVFKTENGFRNFEALLRAFVDLRSFHWQFNCVSNETLLAAQENPEDYRDLVVRVAGYSAIFVDLPLKTQESIIQRTQSEL
jgi:formate C-acetyltransferase